MVTYEFYTFAEYNKFTKLLSYSLRNFFKEKFWDYDKYTETVSLQKELTEKIKSQKIDLFFGLKNDNQDYINKTKEEIAQLSEKLKELEKVQQIINSVNNFEDAFHEIVHLM